MTRPFKPKQGPFKSQPLLDIPVSKSRKIALQGVTFQDGKRAINIRTCALGLDGNWLFTKNGMFLPQEQFVALMKACGATMPKEIESFLTTDIIPITDLVNEQSKE